MLVLSRKSGERILIGDGITLMVVRIDGQQVRIGIEAPPEVTIVREELVEGQEARPEPVAAGGPPLRRPLRARQPVG